MRIAIIDADSILYKILWKNPESDIKEQKELIDAYIRDIIISTGGTHYCLCLTVGRCFRYGIATLKPYKGNRAKLVKPPNFDALKEYLIVEHSASYAKDLYEADDLLFIHKANLNSVYQADFVYCINDKDCLQVNGVFYDYHKKQSLVLTEEEAFYNLLAQLITGDSTDNISGIEGYGEKAAIKILSSATENTGMSLVFNEYEKKYGPFVGIERFYETYKLVKLVTEDESIPLPKLKEVLQEQN